MKITNLFKLVVIFSFLISSVGFAQIKKDIKIIKKGGPNIEILEDEDFDFPFRGRIVELLDLTPSQEKEFNKLKYDFKKKQIDIRAKIQTLRVELRELFEADKPDRTEIEKKLRELNDIQLKMRLNHLDHWFAVYKILDEKQQKIWKQHFYVMKKHACGKMMYCDQPGNKMRRFR